MGHNIGTWQKKNYTLRAYEIADGVHIKINNAPAYKFQDDGKICQWNPTNEEWEKISNWQIIHTAENWTTKIKKFMGWDEPAKPTTQEANK